MSEFTPGQLIKRHFEVKALLEKIDDEHAKRREWYVKSLDAIGNKLLEMANEAGVSSFKGDEGGTAYKSTLMNVKVVNEHELLDFCLDNWTAFGEETLKVSALKPGIEKWLESPEYKLWQLQNPGLAAPGVEVSYFTRMNIRKS